MTKISTTILLATAATAFIAAGPASARTAHHAAAHVATQVDSAGVAYDKNDPYVVLYNGRYVGRDADATVRLNLLRETPMQF